jgi:eukaryotic-like serine/threonine-protein kinase
MSLCPTCRTQCEESVPICPLDGTQLPAPPPLLGQILGDRYRILERIGEGGMGTVYLCEHVALGKRMAVKVLRPEFSSDEELVRRFQQEARAASQIGQENIVDVIDFGLTPDGSMYFAMEALEGESLAKVMRREGKLPLERAFPILGQICKALGAAHARGIVHRDLKPENVILLRRDDGCDFVKILDFGISKNGRGPETSRITRAGSIIGTPEYMAPEQAAASTVDHRCDIYALGVLAYEMVTGALPFQGETPLATLLKHQAEPPEPPSKRRPDLPQEAETLILRALVKRPEGRQQTMAEVAADLSLALAAIGLGPVYTPALGTAVVVGASPTPQRGTATARFAPRPRPASRGGTIALPPDETPPEVPRPRPASRTPPPMFDRARRRSRALLLGGFSAAAAVAVGAAFGVVPFGRAVAPQPLPPAPPQVAAAALDPAPPPVVAPIPVPDAPAPGRVRVTLRSVPAGADVFEGPDRVGVTPLDVEIDEGPGAEYRFSRPGYRSLSRRVRASDGVVEIRLARATRAARAVPPAPEENPYGKVEDLKDPFR